MSLPELPNLPKVYKRKEAKVDSLVLRWFALNYPNSVAIEVKIKGGRILPHQIAALEEVQGGVFYHKLPDTGRRQPFDGFVLKNADAFLVVCDGRNCVVSGKGKNKKTFRIKV